MDERLKHLLRLVVEDVINTGESVGSQRLVEDHELDVSPATIRNWFVELEELGYLTQPHTSSGRVPTEKGYRFYLQELMQERALRQREKQQLQQAALMIQASANHVRRMAQTLAELAGEATIHSRNDSNAITTGLSKLLAKPEFAEHERVMGIGEALDHVDEIMTTLRHQQFSEPTALIGRDCPFGEDCGSVFLTLGDGTLLGILGPLRMNYPRSFALLRQAKRLLEEPPDEIL
jgi:transcriptional regulator of heat shock response